MSIIDLQKTMNTAGITQRELSEQVGRDVTQVNRWYKHNRIGKMWNDNLKDVFNEHGVKIYYLNK